jgi:hydrogenase nickel incorporation protein HypA/HybF
MHELSIAQSIILIVEKTVPIDEQKKIRAIRLQIGSLSGIEIDALSYSFSIIRKSNVFKSAELEIEIITGKGRCLDCNIEFEYPSYGSPCPQCKDYRIKIVQGKEMKIINILTY